MKWVLPKKWQTALFSWTTAVSSKTAQKTTSLARHVPNAHANSWRKLFIDLAIGAKPLQRRTRVAFLLRSLQYVYAVTALPFLLPAESSRKMNHRQILIDSFHAAVA